MLVLSGCQEPDSRSEAFRQSYHQGLDLLERYRLRAAERAFAHCVRLEPAAAEGYWQLGLLAAAVQAGEEAVRLEPERALWRFHLASTYERLDPDQARAEWRAYASLAEDDASEAQRLAHARARLQTLQQEK